MKLNKKLLNKDIIIDNQTTTPTETITSKVKPIGIITPNLPLIITDTRIIGDTGKSVDFAPSTANLGKSIKPSTVTKTVRRSFTPTASQNMDDSTTETSNGLNISISDRDRTLLIASAAIFGFATFAIFFWWICRRTRPGTPLTPLFPRTPITPVPMTPNTLLRWNLRSSDNEPRRREKTE